MSSILLLEKMLKRTHYEYYLNITFGLQVGLIIKIHQLFNNDIVLIINIPLNNEICNS